jgi:hypothetical protein
MIFFKLFIIKTNFGKADTSTQNYLRTTKM